MLELFDMGAHTFFVWLAYGVSIVALLSLIILSVRAKTVSKLQVKKKLDRLNKLKASRALEPKT
jgi:heme exporter protein D